MLLALVNVCFVCLLRGLFSAGCDAGDVKKLHATSLETVTRTARIIGHMGNVAFHNAHTLLGCVSVCQYGCKVSVYR